MVIHQTLNIRNIKYIYCFFFSKARLITSVKLCNAYLKSTIGIVLDVAQFMLILKGIAAFLQRANTYFIFFLYHNISIFDFKRKVLSGSIYNLHLQTLNYKLKKTSLIVALNLVYNAKVINTFKRKDFYIVGITSYPLNLSLFDSSLMVYNLDSFYPVYFFTTYLHSLSKA